MPSDMDTDSGVALYYPYSQIQDINWLKQTLLYWDTVRRIVPASLASELDDLPVVRDLVADGVVVNTPPDPFISGAASSFKERVVPFLNDPSLDGAAEVLQVLEAIENVPLSLDRTHEMQMLGSTNEEIRRLTGHRIGSRELKSDDLGGLYMLCLAAEMSERTGSTLLADTVGYDQCGTYLRFGQPPHLAREAHAPQALLHLDIDFPSPNELSKKPMGQILDFRQKHASERIRFRRMIEGILSEARTLDNVPALQDYFASQRSEIADAGREYRERFFEFGLRASVKFLKVTVPVLAGAAATSVVIPDVAAAAVAAAGVGVAGVSWFATVRSECRDIRREHPVRYTALVQRTFGG